MIHVPVILRADDDRVALLQLVYIAERLPIAVAMAGEGEITDLAGHLRIRVVSETVLVEFGECRTFHEIALPLTAESWNVDLSDELAFLRVLRLHRRIALLSLGDGHVLGLARIRP